MNSVRTCQAIVGFQPPFIPCACILGAAIWIAPAAGIAAAEPNQQRGALESIESTRGGRHWVNAKTQPPKPPAESAACFQIEPGARIELAAAEPIVIDPVAIAFDERGRMFVVEYGDYPTGPESPDAPPLSRVVLLTDEDGDGRMDRRHLFAHRLQFAHSLMPFRGGLLVGAQTEILFLKDTDGDHTADVREVLFRGFTPAHPQMQIGNARWGFDNWIYFNYGPGNVVPGDMVRQLDSAAPASLKMPRKEFRFHPVTGQFGPATGLGQFGNTIDNTGQRFFCTNRNPIMTAPFSLAQLERNPFLVVPRDQYDVAASGGDSRVYPLVAMKSNYLSHAGTHTSACGTTAYHGDLFSSDFSHSVFVCEPIGHLVTRSIVDDRQAVLTARRARRKADFLASTDTWFRPASLATGPDGALYLADMYRLWVEHPKFLPPEIAAKLDWRAGDDRGRIWRIVPDSNASVDSQVSARPQRFQPAQKFTPPQSLADLVVLLADSNGWRRQLGQRLLVERQAKDATAPIRRLLHGDSGPFARIHALATLDGMGELSRDDLARALADSHALVRRDATRLAASRLNDDPLLMDKILSMANDPDPRVRFQTALALGESNDPRVADALARLATRDGTEPWFATAILTSAKTSSGRILTRLLADDATAVSQAHSELLQELATVVGARGDADELSKVLRSIGDAKRPGQWWQAAALVGLANGLPRQAGPGPASLTKLLGSPPDSLSNAVMPIRKLLGDMQSIAVDESLPAADRAGAIVLLKYQPFAQSAPVYRRLLSATQPVDVQQAVIEALRATSDESAAEIVLDRWPQLGARLRGPALELLLRRTTTTRLVLAAMSDGRMNPAVVGIDRRVRLLRHRDEGIRRQSAALFGGAVSKNRRAVADRYSAALKLDASAMAGRLVFDKTCLKCHRMDGRGHEVGPDISDVRNRSREALLYDILDPNQKLEPRFTDYIVVTDDGRVFNGLMMSETDAAVVLRQPEGKQQTIPRREIEQLKDSGKSLMPEGVEKEMTIQQMADLLEYLKAAKRP